MSTSKARYTSNQLSYATIICYKPASNEVHYTCHLSVIDIYQKIHGKDVPATTLAPEVRSRNTFA